MDANVHGGPARRRNNRETETESQKLKREKAAERQRRKRERDRRNAAALQQQQAQGAVVASQHHLPQSAVTQPVAQSQQLPGHSSPPQAQQGQYIQELSPEEAARREKVRAAARDRQRKHRALVKQRRLRELGLQMDELMEEAQYRQASEPQYHSVLPPELQQMGPPPQQPPIPPNEPPFPQGPPLGGQTFASTLLLSFSCAPLLKQHLLRTLGMTNEELASLEPLIAEAWDRWDHQRRLHYAEVAKNGGQPPPLPPPPYAVDLGQHDPHAPPPSGPYPNGPGPSDPAQAQAQAVQAAQAAAAANDFRARFHRSIIAPTPFQTSNSAPASNGSGSAPTEGAIDPHLASSGGSNGASSAQTASVTANGTSKKVH